MSGCSLMEDTSLWIASFSSDIRLEIMNRKPSPNFITPEYVPHGPDRYGGYFSVDRIFSSDSEISNIFTTRSLPVLNLETEEAMGTCSAC
ncbi:hypothetical protein TNCV_5068491 [Trichonephila clavipes]|nr:hypothetical protein TNCV_5068491 [Trichonephila clavipes]